jgi:hypothetical protein
MKSSSWKLRGICPPTKETHRPARQWLQLSLAHRRPVQGDRLAPSRVRYLNIRLQASAGRGGG